MKKIKKNKKGFTLVEIIVVLVILAILAAAAIPTMLGFVDDAKGKAEVANARAAYVAAQTIATELSASGTADTAIVTAITDDEGKAKICTLTGIDTKEFSSATPTVSGGKVTSLVYVGKTHTVTISAGSEATVEKNKSAT